MRAGNEFVPQFEYVRIFAAVSVVLLHVSSDVMTAFRPVIDWQWWIGNIIASATHWAVPVFIMMSGALHLGKVVPVRRFYSKKLHRVAIPLLLSILGFAIIYHFVREDPFSFHFVIKRIIYDQPYEHLYFLFILLFLFAITPLLNCISKTSTKYLFVMFLFCLSITLLWNPGRFLLTFWIPYISYYLAGYFLFHYFKPQKNFLLISVSIIMFVVSMLGTAALTTQLIPNQNGYYFFDYQSPITFLLSVCIYVLFIKRKKEPVSKKIKLFASTTYGVFLIHPIWIILSREIMKLFSISLVQTIPYIGTTFLITIVGSFLTVYFVQKLQAHQVIHTTSLLR